MEVFFHIKFGKKNFFFTTLIFKIYSFRQVLWEFNIDENSNFNFSSGKEKLASMPSGGGAVAASAGVAAPAAAAEEKKGSYFVYLLLFETIYSSITYQSIFFFNC